MSKDIITLRVDRETKEFIDKKVKELNLSRTDFILNSIFNNKSGYTDKIKKMTSALIGISNTIAEKDNDQKDYYDSKDIYDIKKGVANLWHMLK